MTKLRLLPKELLYLSALLGAEAFYGIDDAFAGQSEAEVRKELVLLEDALLSKGYADMDFDGKFSLHKEAERIVRACALCESYSTVWTEENRLPSPAVLYYQRENVIVQMTRDCQELLLQEVDAAEMLKRISKTMDVQASQKDASPLFQIETDDVADIRITGSTQGSVMAQLIERGCDSGIAAVLSAVLCGQGRTSSLLTVNFTDEENPMQALTVMMAQERAVAVSQTESDLGVPMATFACVDASDVAARISAIALATVEESEA